MYFGGAVYYELFFKPVAESSSVTIQMIATEQYFPVELLILLCKVDLTFKSMNEIRKCDYSNESY